MTEDVKLASEDQVQNRTVEQFVAEPVPQVRARSVEVPKVISQECVQQSHRCAAR